MADYGGHSDANASISLFLTGSDDIYVKNFWKPEPGQPIQDMPGCFVGKRFGHGALTFNSIFDIVDECGESVGQALKVCKKSLAARRSLAHEWKMFKDLSLLGEAHPAARSHFLQAHRVMKLPDATIVGIIMEKADGQNVVKTLKDPDFCNVRYVIALLRDLLVALDVAQRVLGFAHYDLKLDNIIEHWGCCPDPQLFKSRVRLDAAPQFKLFDFGTAVVYPDPFSVKALPAEPASPSSSHYHNKSNGSGVSNKTDDSHPPEAAAILKQQAQHSNSAKPGLVTRPHYDGQLEFSQPFCCVRVYHLYWAHRGDVFRVLSSLSRLLDDRVWPIEDLELVTLLLAVLEHATNSKHIRARFAPRAALKHKLGIAGRSAATSASCTGSKQQVVQQQMLQQQLTGAGSAALAPTASPAGVAQALGYSLSQPVTSLAGQGGGGLGAAGAAEAARLAGAASLELGCQIDPAASVVAQLPVADPDAQSVFGSRKAVKGITAQQLLAEPIVQSLLRKVC